MIGFYMIFLVSTLHKLCLAESFFGRPENEHNVSISFPQAPSPGFDSSKSSNIQNFDPTGVKGPNPIANSSNSTEFEHPSSSQKDIAGNTINFGNENNKSPCNDCDKIEFVRKDTPPCDVGDGYCVDDPEYEEFAAKRFKELLKNSTLSNMVRNIIEKPSAKATGLRERIELPTFQDDPVCPTKRSFIAPKRGMNSNKEWVYILNQDDNEQYIEIHKCHKIQFKYDCIPDNQNSEWKGTCRQKFVYKNFLTMDSSGTSIKVDSVSLPSCCVCYISKLRSIT